MVISAKQNGELPQVARNYFYVSVFIAVNMVSVQKLDKFPVSPVIRQEAFSSKTNLLCVNTDDSKSSVSWSFIKFVWCYFIYKLLSSNGLLWFRHRSLPLTFPHSLMCNVRGILLLCVNCHTRLSPNT